MLIEKNLKNFKNALDTWNESKLAVRIYLDISTGDLMYFQYDNLNSWEVFDSDNVLEILARNSLGLIDEPFEYILDEEEFLEAINYSLCLVETSDCIIRKYSKRNPNLSKTDINKLELMFLYEGE